MTVRLTGSTPRKAYAPTESPLYQPSVHISKVLKRSKLKIGVQIFLYDSLRAACYMTCLDKSLENLARLVGNLHLILPALNV